MPEQSAHSLETLLASIWSRREAGIRLPTDSSVVRPITRDDIEYLCNYNYPYLQIMNSDANFTEEVLPKFLALPNGWVLLDYEDAMCSAYTTKYCFKRSNVPTAHVFAKSDEEDGEAGSDGGGEGGGTIIKQQFDTALAMIKEAKNKGWASVEVVAGTTLMQFYAWVVAKELGIDLYGYTPTEEQEKHFKIMDKEKIVARKEKKAREETLSPE